jgi:predicted amidophosphoribosyltransferase
MVEMAMTKEQLNGLARKPRCPRCSLDKTFGSALCRRCRTKLPAHMRSALEKIPAKDTSAVSRALRAAADYLDMHFQSVRSFGGGRRRKR